MDIGNSKNYLGINEISTQWSDAAGLELPDYPGYKVQVKYATEHRCGVVVSGPGLTDSVTDTDPLKDNLLLRKCKPKDKSPEVCSPCMYVQRSSFHRCTGISDFVFKIKWHVFGILWHKKICVSYNKNNCFWGWPNQCIGCNGNTDRHRCNQAHVCPAFMFQSMYWHHWH